MAAEEAAQAAAEAKWRAAFQNITMANLWNRPFKVGPYDPYKWSEITPINWFIDLIVGDLFIFFDVWYVYPGEDV